MATWYSGHGSRVQHKCHKAQTQGWYSRHARTAHHPCNHGTARKHGWYRPLREGPNLRHHGTVDTRERYRAHARNAQPRRPTVQPIRKWDSYSRSHGNVSNTEQEPSMHGRVPQDQRYNASRAAMGHKKGQVTRTPAPTPSGDTEGEGKPAPKAQDTSPRDRTQGPTVPRLGEQGA